MHTVLVDVIGPLAATGDIDPRLKGFECVFGKLR